MIHLVGPGGAGKTTIGSALAERLALRFVDVDAEFAARYGCISAFLDGHGYEVYAERNVALYANLADGPNRPDIVALSSGFMTYADDIHPAYLTLRRRIETSALTFVLLPSLDTALCVAETVRRQLGRPFARSAEREEQVVRTRLPIYVGLTASKVETMRPIEIVVAELVTALAPDIPLAPRA
jgi:shikimate kinase